MEARAIALSFERTIRGRIVRGPSIQRVAGSTWTATHNQAASAGYRSQIPWARCFLYSWGDPLALFVKANVCDISPILISFASSLWMNDNLPASPLRPIPDHPYCHPRRMAAVMLAATRGGGNPRNRHSQTHPPGWPLAATRGTGQPPQPPLAARSLSLMGNEGGRATPAATSRRPTDSLSHNEGEQGNPGSRHSLLDSKVYHRSIRWKNKTGLAEIQTFACHVTFRVHSRLVSSRDQFIVCS